ncbi:hypothetical protein ACFQ6Q_08625 [Streptomyces sp. NPDC056437]|uniref:hypothetical protein n=1 Tax=Streptomyces sp. NPDC056437 TaxID=3345816 RepID=UPI0036933E98
MLTEFIRELIVQGTNECLRTLLAPAAPASAAWNSTAFATLRPALAGLLRPLTDARRRRA